jgi:predicted RNA-binding protein YlxR (DUF448 family)
MLSVMKMRSIKHVPQRTCVACRRVKAKRELVRLVRTASGYVEVDPGGKKAGRGGYLCQVRDCWEKGLKGGRLEHVLRVKLSEDNREQLMKYGEEMKEDDEGAS